MANPIKDMTMSNDELAKLVDWFDTSLESLEDGRTRAMKDRDFYDGNQWSDDQVRTLEERGQPVVTMNHISPKINYILGEQITARVDPAAWPVTPVHEEGADAITHAMRHVADNNDCDITESEAFEDFLIEGCGAILVSQKVRESKDGQRVEILLIPVPWDRFAWDHRSKRRDFRDARWLAAVAWYDLEDAKAIYPDKGDVLDSAVECGGNPDPDLIFGDWPKFWAEKDNQRIRVAQMFFKKSGVWHEAHFTKHESQFLIDPKPVKLVDDDGDTQCPLIAASAYVARRRNDKAPERYGVVRSMISAQEEINKRRSKAMHFVNMAQIITEEGALMMQPEEALEELAKPDGLIKVAPGALREGRIEIRQNLELAQSQFQLLQEAKNEINTNGPQAPLIGTDDRVQTGRSLQVRGEAGEKQLKPVFDSLRYWQRRIYRAIAWQVKKYWPEEMWIRVTDDSQRRGYRFVALNRPIKRADRFRELMRDGVQLPQAIRMIDLQPVIGDELIAQATQVANQEIQQIGMMLKEQTGQPPPPEQLQPMMQQLILQNLVDSPIMQETFQQNSVGHIPTDIKIDVVADSAVLQHEEFEKLAELAGTGQVPIPPSVLIRASRLRDKKELLAELNPPPDPIAQQMQMLQLAMLQAEVEKTRAEAADEMASAQERKANVQFKLESQAAKTQAQALESAAKAGSMTVPEDEEL